MATTELSGGKAADSADAAWTRRIRALRRAWLAVQNKLKSWSAAESGRLALWAPAAIGAGAAGYFALAHDPPVWIGTLLGVSVVWVWISAPAGKRRWAGAAILIAVGFLAADLREARVGAPILSHKLTPREITGRLVSVDESPGARRIVIDVASIARFDGAPPKRIRVTWRGDGFDVLPGDSVRLRAGLAPPPPPAAPGAFDFARQLYFERIGAVGYAVTAPVKIGTGNSPFGARLAAAIERARTALARRIIDKAPGEGGAIVAALVTGKRGAVSERSRDRLRDSGLAHLLAISGLHMGLATGLIFFAVRLGLALVETAALRYPIKKWAAGAALISGFAYLLLSGGGWSAQRAFIMTSIVFVAILVDRRALSLRNVAVAATVILLLSPEAVLHPGFQMSFAAVTALIAAFEWAAARIDPDRSFSIFARVRRYFIGVGLTDLIATSATAPYSLFHFHRIALYSLAANMTAFPLMAFWVAPMAIAALALSPFGIDGWAWRASASGVGVILNIAGAVAAEPGAVFHLPQAPSAALVVVSLGGLWLCLQRAPWRLAGLATFPLAALMALTAPSPDIFVSTDGDNAGAIVSNAKGEKELALFYPRKDSFAAGVWKEYVGLDRDRSATLSLSDRAACDAAGCVARIKGAVVAFSRDPLGLADDCARADLVIALYPVRGGAFGRCKARLIDRIGAWKRGAHAVWIGKDGNIRVRNAEEMRGKRPWTE